MKVKITFYKNNKKLLNFLISAWTWPFNIGTKPYSHVEIGFFIKGEWKYFSSTLRNKAQGTRWISTEELFKHPERWDIYSKECPDENISKMLQRVVSIKGKKYDKLGLVGFVTITGLINDKKKWYCSEAVFYVLTSMWKKRISPRRLSKRVIDFGYKKEKL